MARVHVLKPGMFTTVQDLGRPGWQRHGVTPGGAVDAQALRLANVLVGNAEGAAGLEIWRMPNCVKLEKSEKTELHSRPLSATS